MQYSYAPSRVSVLVAPQTAADVSDQLVNAVPERVGEIPEDEQPRVFVFGESLVPSPPRPVADDLTCSFGTAERSCPERSDPGDQAVERRQVGVGEGDGEFADPGEPETQLAAQRIPELVAPPRQSPLDRFGVGVMTTVNDPAVGLADSPPSGRWSIHAVTPFIVRSILAPVQGHRPES